MAGQELRHCLLLILAWDWADVWAGVRAPTGGAHSLACPQATWRECPGKRLSVQLGSPPSLCGPCASATQGGTSADGRQPVGGGKGHVTAWAAWPLTFPEVTAGNQPRPFQVQASPSRPVLTDFPGEHLGSSWDKCYPLLKKCIFIAWLTGYSKLRSLRRDRKKEKESLAPGKAVGWWGLNLLTPYIPGRQFQQQDQLQLCTGAAIIFKPLQRLG